jgi:predicted GNAT family acetyltransferase
MTESTTQGASSASAFAHVRHNVAASRFEIDLGDALAVAEYRLSGHTAVFTHTEVPVAMRGQGIASRLIAGALDVAREQGWRVVPQCSAVAVYIERHPERRALLDGRG